MQKNEEEEKQKKGEIGGVQKKKGATGQVKKNEQGGGSKNEVPQIKLRTTIQQVNEAQLLLVFILFLYFHLFYFSDSCLRMSKMILKNGERSEEA